MKLSSVMYSTLFDLEFHELVWWHDLGYGAGTAKALWARGLIEEIGERVPCPRHSGRPGTEDHPGYVTISRLGREALHERRKFHLARRVTQ